MTRPPFVLALVPWARPQVGAAAVTEDDKGESVYLVLAPQNIVGSTITTDLEAMCLAAEARGRSVVLLNPILT